MLNRTTIQFKLEMSIMLAFISFSLFGQTPVTFDLNKVPFSYFGSYLTLSTIDNQSTPRRPTNELYLKNSFNRIFKIELCDSMGQHTPMHIKATPFKLTLTNQSGICEIGFENEFVLRFKSWDVNVKFTRIQNNDSSLILKPLDVNTRYIRSGLRDDVITFFSKEKNKTCEFSISRKESKLENKKNRTFEDCQFETTAKLNTWLDSYPSVSDNYKTSRDLALYTNWSAVVSPYKNMSRRGMYMSKNWMSAVWSWDNCFNAMATASGDPQLGLEQIYLMFDKQNAEGTFPDQVNDLNVRYDFVKPPIYGIALNYLMEKNTIPEKDWDLIYSKISKLTNYWLNFRDSDQNGIPEYSHGNDSGWDNSTAFDGLGSSFESADLCALLITQIDFLEILCIKTGRVTEALYWKKKSDKLLKLLLSELWKDGHFIARKTGSNYYNVESKSLINLIPIVLGKKLPVAIRQKIISDIKNDGYMTEFGLASESTRSLLFNTHGIKEVPYWRGAIWAPSTYLIVYGLKASDEKEFAIQIMKQFCDLCVKSGFAENFDAITGTGTGDPSYTWTSSVFLLFSNELNQFKD
jgi:putative isomerase